jgi:hypothetical protein
MSANIGFWAVGRQRYRGNEMVPGGSAGTGGFCPETLLVLAHLHECRGLTGYNDDRIF